MHEIAARLGMDVRDVASRLAALSTTGLPIVVGVECDPNGIRNALASVGSWGNQPSGPHPAGAQPQPPGPPPGPQPPPPQPPGHSGPHGTPGYPAHGGPSGPHPAQSGPYPAPPAYGPPPHQSGPQAAPQSSGPSRTGPPQGTPTPTPPPPGPVPGPSQGAPAQGAPQFSTHGPAPTFGPVPYPAQTGAAAGAANPSSTWGPPGSSSWVRGDQAAPAKRDGRIGSTLDAEGPEGEQLGVQLVEVVDPADFLYTAAGYTLGDGERSVVVHTEFTNKGSMAFTSLPDLYLVLVTADGSTVAKTTAQLSSRPPHRMGVGPGETAGGHTVFVLPERTELASVRWTSRPGDEQRTLTWDISDL